MQFIIKINVKSPLAQQNGVQDWSTYLCLRPNKQQYILKRCYRGGAVAPAADSRQLFGLIESVLINNSLFVGASREYGTERAFFTSADCIVHIQHTRRDLLQQDSLQYYNLTIHVGHFINDLLKDEQKANMIVAIQITSVKHNLLRLLQD